MFLGDRAPGTDAALHGLPLDDAWIHLVYARGLVEEGGFHYNSGEDETGMTSPLWVVLTAGVVGAAGPAHTDEIVVAVKALSLAAGLATLVLLFAIAMELSGSPVVAIAAASLAALDPGLAYSRASGMEVPLFTALALGALWFSLRGRARTAGVIAGLSMVTRPEGAVLLPIYGLLLWGAHRASRPAAKRGGRRNASARSDTPGGAAGPRGQNAASTLVALSFALLPVALYAAFCMHVTGHPLPNTFYAKFAGRNPLDPGLLAFGWKNYVHDDLPWFTLESGSVLAVLGVVRALRERGGRGGLILGGGAVLFVSALASRTYVSGHFFYWERWIAPSFPFLALAIAMGLEEIRTGMSSFRGSGADSGRVRSASMSWAVAAGMAALLLVVRVPAALAERADQFAWNTQNIQEMNVTLGRWIAANTPATAVIGVNDAGALRYFGRRRTIDLLGLNNHRVLMQDPTLGRDPLAAFHVQYLAVFPSTFADLIQHLPLTAVKTVKAPHYTICNAPQDVITAYRLERAP